MAARDRSGFGFGTTVVAVVALLAALAVGRAASAQTCAYPNVLVVLDKSSSMQTGTLESGDTKWAAVKSALEQVLATYDEAIYFGLMVFPSPNQCGTGQVVVDMGLHSADAFGDFLATPPPLTGSYTPLLQTLDALASYEPLQDPTRDNYVLLITDGEQWCSEADSGVYNRDVAPKVSVLRSLGIRTYVVGLSAGVNPCMLGDAAIRGGTALPACTWDNLAGTCSPTAAGQCYYQADDPAALEDALAEIARQVAAEVCDGVDNDCDGQVDGMSRPCAATACGTGEELCTVGVWGACDAPQPSAEVCDGVDNDCDGTTDGMTRPCPTLCGDGVETCRAGVYGGCTAPQPGVETCDNSVDEDCDGQTDEDCGECANGDTRPCGREEGACVAGTQTCVDHAWGPCVGEVIPAVEACNDADDDCDGATDEGLWRSCANACGDGTERCAAGQWGGCDAPQPVNEVCNDIDDDCDGQTDEELTRACTGACGAGQQACAGGDWQECDAPDPVPEFCNGVDDDCDGKTDQGDQLCPVGLLCIDGVCSPDPNTGGEDAGTGGPADAGDGAGGEDVVGPAPDVAQEVTGEYTGQGRLVSGVGGAIGCQAGGPAVPAAGLLLLLPLVALLGARIARRRV